MSVYDGPKIVTNGLVLALDAGNRFSYVSGSTTWTDITNNGNNGTLVNGPTFNTGSGGSIVFDGVDDYVSLGNNQFVSASTFLSLESWVSVTSFTSYRAIINRSQPTDPYGGYQINVNNDSGINKFDFALNLNGTWRTWVNLGGTFGSSLSTGVYYHVVGTYDGTGISMYLNGSLISKRLVTGSLQYGPNITSTNIARNIGNDDSYLNARISVVNIYNRALTASEVLQNYNATKTRFGL